MYDDTSNAAADLDFDPEIQASLNYLIEQGLICGANLGGWYYTPWMTSLMILGFDDVWFDWLAVLEGRLGSLAKMGRVLEGAGVTIMAWHVFEDYSGILIVDNGDTTRQVLSREGVLIA